MPNIEHHAPGSFSWIELGTTDQNAAKKFYSSLFDWTPVDFPMGPNEFYTMFQIDGRSAAAGYTLRPDQIAHHVPPHWMLYVTVEKVDESAKRAGELGAQVLAAPFDVMDVGRMAVIQDPTGAVFSLWEPKRHIGSQIGGVDGTLCWVDLNTPDRDRATQFYKDLFGWTFEKGEKDMFDYLHIRNGAEFIGGAPPPEVLPPNTPPHWMPYILVSNCEGSVAKAEELGGKVCMPPMKIENTGTFAVLADPQGAAFAVFAALPRA